MFIFFLLHLLSSIACFFTFFWIKLFPRQILTLILIIILSNVKSWKIKEMVNRRWDIDKENSKEHKTQSVIVVATAVKSTGKNDKLLTRVTNQRTNHFNHEKRVVLGYTSRNAIFLLLAVNHKVADKIADSDSQHRLVRRIRCRQKPASHFSTIHFAPVLPPLSSFGRWWEEHRNFTVTSSSDVFAP